MAFKRNDPNELKKQLQAMNAKTTYEADPTEWKPTTDSMGNGSAIIRFLPATDNTPHKSPFIKSLSHGFKTSDKRWFIEPCPTTIGKECYVCDFNQKFWDLDTNESKRIASQRKKKVSFWANILVIKDTKKPECEGKVFKFRFGIGIMNKIEGETNPPKDLDLKPQDVTCVFEGSDFIFKVKSVAGEAHGSKYPNYDDSKFNTPSALFGGDESKLLELESKLHDLNAIISTDKFSEYEVIKSKYMKATEKENNEIFGFSQPQQHNFSQPHQASVEPQQHSFSQPQQASVEPQQHGFSQQQQTSVEQSLPQDTNNGNVEGIDDILKSINDEMINF